MFRLLLFFLLGLTLHGMPKLALPTENTAVLQSRPQDFFMYVNRYFEGKDSKPWQAGTYGFVRNMKRAGGEVIGTRFHEGADIKPMRRDGRGVPLDPVKAIAAGTVVHINARANGSNYGKYVVVQHNWGEGPVCSLYAHLNKVSCSLGQRVTSGTELGILGYTGKGIDKTRAHLHFEIALMLSESFEEWHQRFLNSASGHGNYNGLNLIGMDGVKLIQQQRSGQVNTLKQYLRKQKGYYTVAVQAKKTKKLQSRYPWLWVAPQGGAPSSEITFSASGLPLFILPSNRKVAQPTLSGLQPFIGRHEDRTLKRLSGSGGTAQLTKSGKRFLTLLLEDY